MSQSFNTPTDKPGEGEQREELESDLTEVASQAEENPHGNPAEDKTPSLNRNNLEEDVPTETQQTVCQPDPAQTPLVQELSPKTTPALTQKKKPANKEGEGAVQDSLEFQDDPADTDYAPSKYIFIM